MLAELFDSGALNLVYAGVVLVSFIFAVISLVGAEVGDVFDFDADTDSGLDAINISPFAMAMFGATFGIAGLITRIWLNMEPVPSILWATGLGIVVGGLAQAFSSTFSPLANQATSACKMMRSAARPRLSPLSPRMGWARSPLTTSVAG